MAETDVFKHSTPELYDRYAGPLLFAPYAEHVAKQAVRLQPSRILETAAGTGIVTRAVNAALPTAEVVATDINPAVVEFAAQRFESERVTFQVADAQQLPFDDESFDLVLCLFGTRSGRAGPAERRLPNDRTGDGRVVERGLGPRRCARHRARLSVPSRDRTARSIRSRARHRGSRPGAPPLGRSERSDVGTCRDRHTVSKTLARASVPE